METLLGKTEFWYYEGILGSFPEVISVKSKKLGRNLIKVLKKYRKHFARTFKNHFDENVVEFSRQFLEELAKNYGNFKYCYRKIAEEPQRNSGSIWGALENMPRRASKLNPAMISWALIRRLTSLFRYIIHTFLFSQSHSFCAFSFKLRH